MAEIDPPYRLDPLQNIVNVKWTAVFAGAQFHFPAAFGNSGVFDCPQGPAATTISTISFSLSGPTAIPQLGFTISGAPSVSPTIVTFTPGTIGAVSFLPSSKSGTLPGTASFEIIGRTCSLTPANETVGTFIVTIPAITLTETATSIIYKMIQWNATAAASITVSAAFKPL